MSLTSRLGTFVDRVSLSALVSTLIIGICTCAIGYWSLSGIDSDMLSRGESVSFLDSLYFSIVTVSSLGYGDYYPIGWGRLLACAEVMFGLSMIALIVGKISSERQSSITKLIYSNDQNRRIHGFAEDIGKYADVLDQNAREHDRDSLLANARDLAKLSGSLASYLKYQSNQGVLLDLGNTGVLRKLFRSMYDVSLSSYKAAETERFVPEAVSLLERVLLTNVSVANSIVPMVRDDKSKSILMNISDLGKAYHRHRNDDGYLRDYVSEATEALLNRVELELPSGPWPQGIHKSVAGKLGISNSLAQKCIAELIQSGRVSPGAPHDNTA